MSESTPIISLYQREGTVFYHDDQLTQEVAIISHLSVTAFMTVGGQTKQHWRQHGLLANMAEGIANYMIANPGMKEAIDGMYSLIKARHGRIG